MSQLAISILPTQFDPDPARITSGSSIVWINKTSVTQDATSSDDGLTFQTGPIPPGQSSLPITFDDGIAEIPYLSTTTPALRGTVIVSNP